MDQGKLLAYIGMTSALIQGAYVRRVAHVSVSEKSLVLQGMTSCALGLILLSLVATRHASLALLYAGATGLAFTSATVVSSLTAMATFEGGGAGISFLTLKEWELSGELVSWVVHWVPDLLV